jgi:hypothetical protein
MLRVRRASELAKFGGKRAATRRRYPGTILAYSLRRSGMGFLLVRCAAGQNTI